MTNQEIDRAACEFAGLEPWAEHEEGCNRALAYSSVLSCCKGRKIYPSVSTDWAAAGRLMDALRAKGFKYQIDCDPMIEPAHRAIVQGSHDRGLNGCVRVVHDSGPMALALAVKALAEAGR